MIVVLTHSSTLRNALRSSIIVGSRRGVANKAYPDHVPLNTFEHAFLTVGTGLAALLDPKRGGGYDVPRFLSAGLMDRDQIWLQRLGN